MRLLNGILSLSYTNRNDIKLHIKNPNLMFEINSPDTVKHTRDLENSKTPKIFEKKPSSLNLKPVVASPNFVTRKLKISMEIQNNIKEVWLTLTISL